MKIELSVDELNTVLASLAKQPYEFVFKLIANIQQQAQAQLSEQNTANTAE